MGSDVDNKNKAPHTQEEKDKIGYDDVKDSFTQQDEIIVDRFNERWVQCKMCGKIKKAICFAEYGGKGESNLGKCNECF